MNAIVHIYNTKGDVVSDLDSLQFTWPDGSKEMVPNKNGIITLDKVFHTLNGDTTATVTHKHPNKYLNWFIGTTNDTDKVVIHLSKRKLE